MNNLNYIIESRLWRYGQVSLPEIGTLYLRSKTKEPDWQNQLIHAPDLVIEFNNVISKAFHEEAEEMNRNIADSILKELNAKDICTLPGFGQFYKVSNSDEIHFFSYDHHSFQKFSDNLPSLSFEWSAKTKSEITPNVRHQRMETPARKKKRNWHALWLLIPVVFAVSWLIWAQFSGDPELTPLPNGRVNLKPGEQMDEPVIERSDIEEKFEVLEDESTSTLEEVASESENKNNGLNLNQNPEPFTEDCQIVVGSFKVSENSARFANKLNALGYSVSQIKFGEYTRVTIPITCLESADKIQQIKHHLELNAWVIKR